MSIEFVVEYRGNLAWSKFEDQIEKILGRNALGTGFCLMTGNRDMSANFKTLRGLENTKKRLQAFAKTKRVKLKFHEYPNED